MKTIESILKHAEQIGKLPGQKQEQRNMNNIKIGMRLAIAECQKWIPVDENTPLNVELFIKDSEGMISVGELTPIGFDSRDGLIDIYNITHYRQIEIK